MKKKYLALILACFMTVPLFLSSCGRIADAIVKEDEDEDDDDDKDDDKDDDEEEEEPVYIDVIDDDDLEGQIDAIVKNMDDWFVSDSSSAPISEVGYCVTDLDHNGRAEVISVTRFDYGDTTEVHVYEVDEKGKNLVEAKWKYKGLEQTTDKYPDFNTGYYIGNYFDKKENESHYLLDNFFDAGDGEFGNAFIDLKYADGKITAWTYAAYIYNGDTEFFFDDGTEVSDDEEFLEHRREFPKRRNEIEVHFGLFTKSYSDLYQYADIDNDELKEILTASYAVFSGEKDFEEFDETYNVKDEPQDSDEIDYEDMLGRWVLYSSDDGYDVEYYDETSDCFTLVFFEDYEARFTVYFEGEPSDDHYLSVDLSGIYPSMEMRDPEHEYLDDSIDYVSFLVMKLSSDKKQMLIYYLLYDEDGYITEGYELVFNKDENYAFTDDADYEDYVGEWGLVSSETEGDVSYYQENGKMYVTLSIYDDYTIHLKEYEYGKVFWELEADVQFDNDGKPCIPYSDQEALTDVVASEVYTIEGFVDDRDTLQVSIDFYDQSGGWLGYTTLIFERQ